MSMPRKFLLAGAVAMAMAWVGVTLAASAPEDPYTKAAAALYEQAKKEGALVVYSVWDVEHIVAILGGFKKRYPGIQTSYWQGRNPEIVTRVITEFQAGKDSV